MAKPSSLKSIHFIGVSLAGGKTDKTAISAIEYYPEQKKIFLSHLHHKITWDEESVDSKICRFISEKFKNVKMVAFDVPLIFPKCIRCKLKCPGYETCSQPEIKWLRQKYDSRNLKKRPRKQFTPYTERCSEFHIAHELEEKFYPSQAMGANMAPLLARAHFLKRRLNVKAIEVYPRLSLWRIGRHLGIQKSYLRFHKHSVEGLAIRKAIIDKLQEKNVAFLYAQDIKVMTHNCQAFESFICALTAVLKYVNQCEKRPKGYPKSEAWVEFPVKNIEAAFMD